jgi:hypothetical protein
VTATPRHYGGITFRSTLEADWANTLDTLSIRWEYENRLVTLPQGAEYLPDFWLPDLDTYIEVKGVGVGREWKTRQLAALSDSIVLFGRTSYPECLLRWQDALSGHPNTLLGQCPACSAWSWVRIRHSLACRKCRRRITSGRLYRSGERKFSLVDRFLWTAAS